MGTMVFLESDGAVHPPRGFGDFRSDTKNLASLMMFPTSLARLGKILGVDSAALGQCTTLSEGAPEADSEELAEERETAWQKPAILLDCLQNVIAGLGRIPDASLRAELEAAPTHFVDLGVHPDYLVDGGFREDLEELVRLLRWYREHGTERVRLELG